MPRRPRSWPRPAPGARSRSPPRLRGWRPARRARGADVSVAILAERDEVAGLGGVLVIGMDRHASSRLDDQLRGRSARQGDPGGSVFFLSMEDELITTCVPDAEPVASDGPDGRVTDPKADWTVGHAQRVAEGVHLQIHRDTWRYNTLLEDQ